MKPFINVIFLLHFCFFGYAMESNTGHQDVWSLIFFHLSWLDRHNVSLTSKWLQNFVRIHNENSLALKKITSFTKSKSVPVVFCCCKENFCIFQQNDSDSPTDITMFDGATLEQRNETFNLSLANNHFASCQAGVCYSQDSAISILSMGGGRISSSKLFSGFSRLTKLFCVNDNVVCCNENTENVSCFSIKENSRGMLFSGDVKHCSGIGKTLFLFGVKGNYRYSWSNYGSWPCPCCSPGWQFPVIACANNSSFMITCHNDSDSSALYFCKTSLLEYQIVQNPMQVKLKFTSPILDPKLFLYENNLLVVGNINHEQWLFLIYSLDEEKIIIWDKFNGNQSESHLVENNLFVVFKSCCDEKDMETFEVKIISLGNLN